MVSSRLLSMYVWSSSLFDWLGVIWILFKLDELGDGLNILGLR